MHCQTFSRAAAGSTPKVAARSIFLKGSGEKKSEFEGNKGRFSELARVGNQMDATESRDFYEIVVERHCKLVCEPSSK